MKLTLRQQISDAHEDSIWSCAWMQTSDSTESTDQTKALDQLVTGSVDESVKSWVAGDDQCKFDHNYTGHCLGVISVAVDNQGLVASSALDSAIRVWDIKSGATVSQIDAPPAELWSIAFNPSVPGTQITAAGGAAACVNVWGLESKETVATFSLPPPGHDKDKTGQFVLSVAYSKDGKRLAAGAMDGSVAIFDVQTCSLLHLLKGHRMPVRALDFSPDSRHVITACDDMHIHMYDVEHASLIGAMSGHNSWVLDVAYNPDGSGFVSSSSDRTIRVWDAQARASTQTHSLHTDSVWSLAFRPDGIPNLPALPLIPSPSLQCLGQPVFASLGCLTSTHYPK
eukprot:gene22495-27148_t